MSSRKKSGAKKGKKKSGARPVNLGDLGPDALATFDAANAGSTNLEDDEDEDDDEAVLHPVSQMMFPLDETKALLDVEEEYPEETLSEPHLALAKARILSLWIALVQESPQSSSSSSSRVSAAAGYGALMTPELHSIVHVEMMHLGMAKSINDAAKMLCSVSRRLSDQGMLGDKELADLTVWERNIRMSESLHGSRESSDGKVYEEVLTMIEWVRRRIHPPNDDQDEDSNGDDDAASDEVADRERLGDEDDRDRDSWALSTLPPGSEVEMQTTSSAGSEAAWGRLEVGALAQKSSSEELTQSSSSSSSKRRSRGRDSSTQGMGNKLLGNSGFPQGAVGGEASDGALAGASRALTVLCRAATVYQVWQTSEVQAMRQRPPESHREPRGDSTRLEARGRSGARSRHSNRNGSGKGRSSDGKDEGEYDPEAEIGRAIKRVCYKEACHLLSPPEVSLLLCWLGDDDNREQKAKIAELEPALQQVEAWAPLILKLIQSPSFSEHRSLVMSVVKTAHWHLVKMWEFEGDYSKALAAQVTLKASTLVECQPEELRIVEAAARQYRWTELKERGEELFAEGQYTACRALHEQALASPDLFLANTNHKAVSEQAIRNCQHQAKHDLRRSKAPSHQTAATQTQQQQSGVAKLAQHLKDRAAASSEHALDDSASSTAAAGAAALAAQEVAAAASRARCAATIAFACTLSHQDLRRELRLGSDLHYQNAPASSTALTNGSGSGSEMTVAGGSGSGDSSGGGVDSGSSSSKGAGSKKASKHSPKGSSGGGKNGWALHNSSSSSQRGHNSKSSFNNDAALVASAVVNLEAKGASLAANLEALHDCLSPEMRTAAVLRPSLTQHSFADRLRESWPCQQTISELVHGQPTRVQVFECLTCRGVGGAGGRLHLVCDTCRRVNHAARGHRVRPLGTAFECDDSACVSPWCPEFRVRTLLPASKDAANASSGLTNSSINSSSSGSVDKPSDGDQSRANGSNSSGGVQTSRLFSAARGEGFDAAITPPSTAASAAGTSGAIPSPHDEASAMLRMIAPLLDGSKIELSLEMPEGPAATSKYLTELLQKAEYTEALDECILANQANKHEKLENWSVDWLERWNAKRAELKRAETAAAAHAAIYETAARSHHQSDRSNLRRRKPAKDGSTDEDEVEDSAPEGYLPLSGGSDHVRRGNEGGDEDDDVTTKKALSASQQVLAAHRWATGATDEDSSQSLEAMGSSVASSRNGGHDDGDEGDALESGRLPGHGRGVSEVERDVVRLRELLREMEQSLVNDLSLMHVDMVLLQALYRQAALAKLAKAIRRKLEASRGRSEDQLARAATLAAEQEAEDAMRALEMEEVNLSSSSSSSSKANSKGGASKGGHKGHQKSGGAKGSSSSSSSGDGNEAGSNANPVVSSAAPKKLTKKQKEKEKARQKREEDEAKAAAIEAQRAAKLSEAQARREAERREALRAAQAAREKEEQAVLSAQREARLAAEKALAAEEERMVAEALAASEELARVAAEREKQDAAASAAAAAAAAQAKAKEEEVKAQRAAAEEKDRERKIVEADKANALLAIEKARAAERATKTKSAKTGASAKSADEMTALKNASAEKAVADSSGGNEEEEDDDDEEVGFTVSFGNDGAEGDEGASPQPSASPKVKLSNGKSSGKAASDDDDEGETESEASIAEASVSDSGEPSRNGAALRRMRPDAPTFQPTMAAAAAPAPSYPSHHHPYPYNPYMYAPAAGGGVSGSNGMYPLGPTTHGGSDQFAAQGMMPPMYFVPPPSMDPTSGAYSTAPSPGGGPATNPQYLAAQFQQLVHAYGPQQAQQMMHQMQQQLQLQQQQQQQEQEVEYEDDEEEEDGYDNEEVEGEVDESGSEIEADSRGEATTTRGTTTPSTSAAEAQLRQMLALPPNSNKNNPSTSPPPQPDSKTKAAAADNREGSSTVTSEQQQKPQPPQQSQPQRTADAAALEGAASSLLSPADQARATQLQAAVKQLCGGKRLSDSVALALFRLFGFNAKFTAAVAGTQTSGASGATANNSKRGAASAAAPVGAGGNCAQNPLVSALLAAFTEMGKVDALASEAKGGAPGKGSGGKSKGNNSSSAVASPPVAPLPPSAAFVSSLNALAAAAEVSGWRESSNKSSTAESDAPSSCASLLALLDRAPSSRGCVREAFGVNLVSAFPVLGAAAATPPSSSPFVATAALSALNAAAAAAAKAPATTAAGTGTWKGGGKPSNGAAAPSFEACWRAAYAPWKDATGVARKPEVVALGLQWDTSAAAAAASGGAGGDTRVAGVWAKWVPPLLNLSRLLDPPPPGQVVSPPAGGGGGGVLGQANLRAVICSAADVESEGSAGGGYVVMAQRHPTHRGFSNSTWVACAGVLERGSSGGEGKGAAAAATITGRDNACPAAVEVGPLAAVKELATVLRLKPLVLFYEAAPQPPAATAATSASTSGSGNSSSKHGKGGGKGSARHHGSSRGSGGSGRGGS